MNRSTMMTWVLSIGIVAVACNTLPLAAQSNRPTTVYVVRHAEKASAPPADPPLTTAGEARAKALADTAKADHVNAIITTQFLRTKETAAPSAKILGITPEVIPATTPTHIQDVAAAVRKHHGETLLVVEHSNTVPDIIAALGAPKPPAICDAEYDNLYVVRIAGDGRATVKREHYGARTPVAADCGKMR